MADVHPRPAPARTGPLAASRPARLAAVVVAVVSVVSVASVASVAWGAMVAIAPVAARPAQDPGVTTTFPVDASTTTVAGSTTVAPTGETVPAAVADDTAESTGTGSRRVADENRKIWAVVAGLVLVAIALSLLTIRYWRRTRPVAPSVDLMLPTDAALAMALTSEPDTGSSADAVAVPAGSPVGESSSGESSGDASGADEPPAAKALDVVEVAEVAEPSATEVVEPPASEVSEPSGVEAAGIVELPDTGDDTAPVPVVDVPPASPRRAVAGADHPAADEAWAPRGTGEHERVVVAPAARPQRLSAEQRADLFARREPRDP